MFVHSAHQGILFLVGLASRGRGFQTHETRGPGDVARSKSSWLCCLNWFDGKLRAGMA